MAANASWNGRAVAASVPGGPTRAESVRCGLAAVPGSAEIIVVHDAAHPLAGKDLFASVIEKVRAGADAATLAIPSAETFARVRDGSVVATEPRQALWITQTPHAFRAEILRAAHSGAPEATDDIALLVSLGRRVDVRSWLTRATSTSPLLATWSSPTGFSSRKPRERTPMTAARLETLLVDEPLDNVLLVTLNRPEVSNAFNTQCARDLHEVFAPLELDLRRYRLRRDHRRGRARVLRRCRP